MRCKFAIEPYSMELTFMWNVRTRTVLNWLKKTYDMDIDLGDNFAGISIETSPSSYLIYIPEAKNNILTYQTCVHEACHVAQWVLDKVNVTEDESLCYCVDNIVGKMFVALNKKFASQSSHDNEHLDSKA